MNVFVNNYNASCVISTYNDIIVYVRILLRIVKVLLIH